MSKVEFKNGSTVESIDSQDVNRGEIRILFADIAQTKDNSVIMEYDTVNKKWVCSEVDSQEV